MILQQVGDESHVIKGKHCYEFLLMRSFATIENAAGSPVTRTLVSEPIELPSKHTWITYGALAQWLPLARSCGHRGYVQYHYILDGGLYTSLSRRCRQMHDLWYEQQTPTIALIKLRNKEWILATLCGIHVGHNALKWGCFMFMRDIRADTKQMFGVSSAVRDCFLTIVEYFKVFCAEWHGLGVGWGVV